MKLLCFTFISFSDSPRHFEVIVLDDILKKAVVLRVSEQSVFAINVFPLPSIYKRNEFNVKPEFNVIGTNLMDRVTVQISKV